MADIVGLEKMNATVDSLSYETMCMHFSHINQRAEQLGIRFVYEDFSDYYQRGFGHHGGSYTALRGQKIIVINRNLPTSDDIEYMLTRILRYAEAKIQENRHVRFFHSFLPDPFERAKELGFHVDYKDIGKKVAGMYVSVDNHHAIILNEKLPEKVDELVLVRILDDATDPYREHHQSLDVRVFMAGEFLVEYVIDW